MKKLIAFALALMLLLATAACAERAKVMTYSEPYLRLDENGKSREVDLSNLRLSLASGTPGDVPTVQAEVTRKGKVIQRGVAQCIDGQVYIDVDGLGKLYTLDLSQYGDQGRSLVNAVFADLEYLLDFKLPAFGGVKIPMVDMTVIAPLTGSIATTDENGKKSAKIELPYAMVKQLMTMAGQYRNSMPGAVQAYAGQLFDLMDQMVQSDSGFALKGTVSATKKKSTLSLKLYPVTDGVTAEAPAAKIKLVSAKNQVDFTVDMYQGESTVNAVTFNLTSTPKKAALSFSLDVMSLILVNGSLGNDDGMQTVALEFNSLGQKAALSANYGAVDDVDRVNVSLSVPNQFDLSASIQAAEDGDGGSEGTSALNVQTYGDAPVGVALTGDVAEGYEDVSFQRIKKTSGAVDLLHMTDEQSKQLNKELNRLMEKFLSGTKIDRR